MIKSTDKIVARHKAWHQHSLQVSQCRNSHTLNCSILFVESSIAKFLQPIKQHRNTYLLLRWLYWIGIFSILRGRLEPVQKSTEHKLTASFFRFLDKQFDHCSDRDFLVWQFS